MSGCITVKQLIKGLRDIYKRKKSIRKELLLDMREIALELSALRQQSTEIIQKETNGLRDQSECESPTQIHEKWSSSVD